ncbi:hypothetical protein Bp8pS_047 [Bacillus phage vB_BpuM-BpSp]|nr:hypothetical protein Bp8pS_047 [Bacillus phage vB_BpuM-BpSp]
MKNLITITFLRFELFYLKYRTKETNYNMYTYFKWLKFTKKLVRLFVRDKINFNIFVKYKYYLRWSSNNHSFDEIKFYNKLGNEEINQLRDNKGEILLDIENLLTFRTDIDEELISMCNLEYNKYPDNLRMWVNISRNGKLSEKFIKDNVSFLHRKELFKNKNIDLNSKVVTLLKLEDI